MRYAQGGGFIADGRRRRELVRQAAVEMFEHQVPAAEIAAELRVTDRSVRRWRKAWKAEGTAGLASKGQATRCRLGGTQLAELDRLLDAGPLAAGYEDQRWTLARVECHASMTALSGADPGRPIDCRMPGRAHAARNVPAVCSLP